MQPIDATKSFTGARPKTVTSLLGGSLSAGKTSNIELDDILSLLTRNRGPDPGSRRCGVWVATCDAYHKRECAPLKRALEAGTTDLVLLPIFTRAHWLVAALTWTQRPNSLPHISCKIHDSAPSAPVRRDIEKALPCIFPGVAITFARCTQQRRGSDDCGIFMLSTIAVYLIRTVDPTFEPQIDDTATPARLRSLLSRKNGTRVCLSSVKSALTAPLQGGSASKNTSHTDTSDTIEGYMARNKEATAVWQRACALDRPASDQNLCHVLAATALESFASGKRWQTTVRAMELRARQMHLKVVGSCPDGRRRYEQQALVDTLRTPLHWWGDMTPGTAADAQAGSSRNVSFTLSGPVTLSAIRRFVVATAPDENMLTHLPNTMEVLDDRGLTYTARFLLGSFFVGQWARSHGGQNPQIGVLGATNGHYALTLVPSRATVAVYEIIENVAAVPSASLSAPLASLQSEKEVVPDDEDVSIIPHLNEMPDETLVSALKSAKLGDSITVIWQPRRPGPPEATKNVRWTGTVEGDWHPNFRSIAVLWDATSPGVGTKRRRVLPEATLPDPDIRYIDVTILSTPKPDCATHPKPDRATHPKPDRATHPKPDRATHPKPDQDKNLDARRVPTRPSDGLEEPPSRVHTATTRPGNDKGRLDHGDRVCPRAWYIFPDRPPHVSKLAWEACSPDVRKQHIKWLREIRSMPADLLPPVPIAQAVLELIRRMAIVRRWRWSTIERAMASARSALAHITLYTNVATPIDLDRDPEWRAAKKGALKFKNETPPNPPPPLNITEYEKARAELQHLPKARLLLSMLWAFAARAGDITGLVPEDIIIGKETPAGLTKIALTVRRGKGATFRGPYPLASMIRRVDAQELRQWMAQTPANTRVFSETTSLKNAVRAALKKCNSAASLPSIRKGAARHLAQTGMAEEDLMQLLGHTQRDTTRKYLGHGQQLTSNQRRAQRQTGSLQSGGPPLSPAETDEESEPDAL
jgi:integrase